MSVAKSVDNGCKVLLEPETATVLSGRNEIQQTTYRRGNLSSIESANAAAEDRKS